MKMRVAASVAVTALVTGALSGCMFFTPQQTARSYTPADGVNGSVGDVAIRNVLLLTDEKPSSAQSANMLGVLVNSSDSAKTVTLEYQTVAGSETTTLTVPANGLLSVRPVTASQSSASVTTRVREVQLEDVDATPGGLFNVGFSVGGGTPITLKLPVLTGSVDGYSSLLPTETPTPTPSPTVSDDATAEPTDTPSPSATD